MKYIKQLKLMNAKELEEEKNNHKFLKSTYRTSPYIIMTVILGTATAFNYITGNKKTIDEIIELHKTRANIEKHIEDLSYSRSPESYKLTDKNSLFLSYISADTNKLKSEINLLEAKEDSLMHIPKVQEYIESKESKNASTYFGLGATISLLILSIMKMAREDYKRDTINYEQHRRKNHS